jgi:hypothetical protein
MVLSEGVLYGSFLTRPANSNTPQRPNTKPWHPEPNRSFVVVHRGFELLNNASVEFNQFNPSRLETNR